MNPDFLRRSRRRVMRMEGNPMDKSTVISIYPKEIVEVKYTLQPNTYQVPAGSYDNPALVVFGSASWWREIDPEQPLLEIPVSSVQIASSVINDYCNGLLACNMGDKMPGLFFLPGEIDLDLLKKKYQKLIDAAQEKQKNWYATLVKLGDVMWARTNGNPIAISDDMRFAARELKMDKPWVKDFQHMSLVPCRACGAMRNPLYPVCQVCKAVADPESAAKLGLKFAS